MFKKNKSYWNHELGIVTIYKEYKNYCYIIAREPIMYGDPRNQQLSYWNL